MAYKYGMRLRGFSIGCQPKGVIERMDDSSGRYYDILIYDRPLTRKELEDYELDDLNEEGAKMMAKYYVVDCISGCMDGVDPFANLEDAIEQRDMWNEESKAEHNSSSFWMIVDEDGKEVV